MKLYIPFFLALSSLAVKDVKAEGVCDLTTIPVEAVATPADGAIYDESRKQWASKMGSSSMSDAHLSPEAIVYCNNEEDVLGIVDFAVQCDYKIAVRSGGHQYSGYSSCEEGTRCIQVDVSGLQTFAYDPDSNLATLGAGLKIENAVQYFAGLGLVLPMGICKSVGIGGHLQTSSLGFFASSFGSGMDLVRSFRIVTADGTIQTVTPDSNEDLFKAVLGGGPGSWGVVLDYTVEPIKATSYPFSAGFTFVWPYNHDLLVALGQKYVEIVSMPEIADDLTPLLVVAPPEQAPTAGYFGHVITLAMVWTGKDNGGLFDNHDPASPNEKYNKYIQPFKDIAAPYHTAMDTPMPINHLMYGLTFDFNHDPFRYHVASHTTDDYSLDGDYWETVATELDGRMAIDNFYSSVQFQGYGGSGDGSQLNRNTGLNHFPFRDLKIHIDDWVFFMDDDQEEVARDRVNGLRDDTKKYWRDPAGTEGFWMTTRTSDVEDVTVKDNLWKEFYPDRRTFMALQEVKEQVDPLNVFSSHTTIPLKN